MSELLSDLVTRAEVCVVAVAECFRGDGEILANPIGTIPMIGGRLARASFEPDLCMTDGEATLVANDEAFDWPGGKVVEYWNPYRSMFDWVWSGRRHVMMGATQIDRYGNQNIAAIGDYARPKVQLLGYRGAPRVSAGADTNRAVLPDCRRDLLADPAGRTVESTPAHPARFARQVD